MEKGFDYAPIWKRLVANILDYTIVYGVFFIVLLMYGEPNDEGGLSVNGLPALIPVIFWLLYIVFVEYQFEATLGHQVVKLKVVKEQGHPLRFKDVLKRRFFDFIDQFVLIGIVLIKNTPNRQRIGDIVAKTVVVNE